MDYRKVLRVPKWRVRVATSEKNIFRMWMGWGNVSTIGRGIWIKEKSKESNNWTIRENWNLIVTWAQETAIKIPNIFFILYNSQTYKIIRIPGRVKNRIIYSIFTLSADYYAWIPGLFQKKQPKGSDYMVLSYAASAYVLFKLKANNKVKGKTADSKKNIYLSLKNLDWVLAQRDSYHQI